MLCARPTTFAGPDIEVGTVPSIASFIVELLAGGTEAAVAFGLLVVESAARFTRHLFDVFAVNGQARP